MTYYYDDTSEHLTNINSAKIIIDKKDKLNKFVLHGAAGNNIEYYGANISLAKKIDSDGGKLIIEANEFLEGVSNDDIQLLSGNMYLFNSTYSGFTPDGDDYKIAGNDLLTSFGLDVLDLSTIFVRKC